MTRYITVREAAALLRVKEPTVRRFIRERKIAARRIGRKFLIDESAVVAASRPVPSGTLSADQRRRLLEQAIERADRVPWLPGSAVEDLLTGRR